MLRQHTDCCRSRSCSEGQLFLKPLVPDRSIDHFRLAAAVWCSGCRHRQLRSRQC
jgi:hypothetical protein